MGKRLIIKGADFSQVAVNLNVLVSSEQSSLGTNTYYNDVGITKNYSSIESVQKISIPDGVTSVKPTVSTSGLEPEAINCFNDNGPIGLAGGEHVGGGSPLGTHGWYELLNGTKYISYVYKSTVTNINMGLAITWMGR